MLDLLITVLLPMIAALQWALLYEQGRLRMDHRDTLRLCQQIHRELHALKGPDDG